jgi:uncharacterized cupredoxin-like copper-binding protein
MVGAQVASMAAALLLVASACAPDGPDGSGAIAAPAGTPESPRTIEVAMVDIAFEPTALSVQAGETVKFVFTNEGAAEHEATFGDEAEQDEHATAMRDAEGMEGMDMGEADAGHDEAEADHDEAEADHDEAGATPDGHDEEGAIAPVVLKAGESGEMIVTFDDPDATSTIIGCHIPGHWEAGMRLDVTVDSA